MVVKTRRMLTACAVLAVLTLPLEMVTLDLMKRSRRLSVAEAWVRRLSPAERQAAVSRIREYPVSYRRALLGSLSRAGQAEVWHRTTAAFLERHPNLTVTQKAAVNTLLHYATAQTFEDPLKSGPAREAAAQIVLNELGRAAFNELFLRDDVRSAWSSPLPARVALEDFIDRQFVLNADPNCNCYTLYQSVCGGGNHYCTEQHTCDFWYVGCGIWYMEPCNGYCS